MTAPTIKTFSLEAQTPEGKLKVEHDFAHGATSLRYALGKSERPTYVTVEPEEGETAEDALVRLVCLLETEADRLRALAPRIAAAIGGLA